MNKKEAIKNLENPPVVGLFACPAYAEATRIAIEALKESDERDRKEKPMEVTDIHPDEYCCPACGSVITKDNSSIGAELVVDNYCPECGQRLFPAFRSWDDE